MGARTGKNRKGKARKEKGESRVERLEEEVIEVLNGCICCTVRGDLVAALKRMHERVQNFDAVLIETTGMADPAPVAQTFFVDDDVQRMYKLDGIITVCDALHLERHLDKEVAEGAENESVEQLAFADKVLLNKCDLVMAAASGGAGVVEGAEDCVMAGEAGAGWQAKPDAEIKNGDEHLDNLEARIKQINKTAEIIRTSHAQIDPHRLLGMNAFSLERVLE